MLRSLALLAALCSAVPSCTDPSCTKIVTTDDDLEGSGMTTQTAGPALGVPVAVDLSLGQLTDGVLLPDHQQVPPMLSLGIDQQSNLAGVLIFDAVPLQAALATGINLLDVPGGTLLVGQTFTFPLGDAFEAWQGSSGSATVTVVPAQQQPPPLLTVDLAMPVQSPSGAQLGLGAVLAVDVLKNTSSRPGSDCFAN